MWRSPSLLLRTPPLEAAMTDLSRRRVLAAGAATGAIAALRLSPALAGDTSRVACLSAPEIRANAQFIVNADYDKARAQAALDAGAADAVSFGRRFISNPDVFRRLMGDISLSADDISTWYSPGDEGYLDYALAT
jgi:2,4-dienoyl-CoA reductase-like NADH-dependent reductase (Old Yellow Enzyme family)